MHLRTLRKNLVYFCDHSVLVEQVWALMTMCVLTIRVYGASFFSLLSSGGGAVDCPGCAGVSGAAEAGPVGDVSTKSSSDTRKRISSPWSMYRS